MTTNARVDPSRPPTAPVTDLDAHVTGGGILTNQWRGIQNGVPYGEQLLNERADLARTHRFSPGLVNRLRGATRKALRRG